MVCCHWRHKPLQNVSKWPNCAKCIYSTSVTLETLLKHFGDYKTFLRDSKLKFFHTFILRYWPYHENMTRTKYEQYMRKICAKWVVCRVDAALYLGSYVSQLDTPSSVGKVNSLARSPSDWHINSQYAVPILKPRNKANKAHWPFELGALHLLHGLYRSENWTEKDGDTFIL